MSAVNCGADRAIAAQFKRPDRRKCLWFIPQDAGGIARLLGGRPPPVCWSWVRQDRETKSVQDRLPIFSSVSTVGAERTGGIPRPRRAIGRGPGAGAWRGGCTRTHARKRGQVVRRSEL